MPVARRDCEVSRSSARDFGTSLSHARPNHRLLMRAIAATDRESQLDVRRRGTARSLLRSSWVVGAHHHRGWSEQFSAHDRLA